MSLEKIESIKKVSKALKANELGEDSEGLQGKDFKVVMQDTQNKEATSAQKVEPTKIEPTATANKIEPSTANKPSPIELHNQVVEQIKKSSPADVVAQAHNVISKIDEIKTKLATPNLELKSSIQSQLKNKLSHIDENLKIALSKAGVEYKAPTEKASGVTNPIERFLGFLTDGQSQLKNLASEVETMHLKKGEISPASMLLVQIKVGYIQQELEFFTSLLNKALESTKTIMNVQV